MRISFKNSQVFLLNSFRWLFAYHSLEVLKIKTFSYMYCELSLIYFFIIFWLIIGLFVERFKTVWNCTVAANRRDLFGQTRRETSQTCLLRPLPCYKRFQTALRTKLILIVQHILYICYKLFLFNRNMFLYVLWIYFNIPIFAGMRWYVNNHQNA